MIDNDSAICKHCNKVIGTVPKHYCPRSPNHMHEPVEPPTVETGKTIDITPEDNARVAKAMKVWDDCHAQVANMAVAFLRELLPEVQIPNDLADDLRELTAAIKRRECAQEEFLRAVAGAPPAQE